MRYDGFPPLWYICLWFISLVTSAPVAMQLFHFACSFAAQFLVMLRAPFSPVMKLAIIAGYYISFEYCVISRAYVMGVLLIFGYCAYHEWFDGRPAARAVLWGLLANTSVYGAILSLAFVADELLSLAGKWRSSGRFDRSSRKTLALLVLLYGGLLAVAISFMVPPPDGKFMSGWNLDMNAKIFLFFRNALFLLPVPLPKPDFWNTLALMDFAGSSRWMVIPAALIVWGFVWLSLKGTPRRFLLFVIGYVGIFIFTAEIYYGYSRHVGAEMVLFLSCVWLATDELQRRGRAVSCIAFWSILTVNILASGIAAYYHLHYDFSGSREMASILSRFGGTLPPIVADSDYATSPVAGYLNRPLYYAANRKSQTYIRWNSERTGGGAEDALTFAGELATKGDGRVWMLLNYPLENGHLKLIAKTREEPIEADERLYLYEYDR
jgi:hypothetical protein